MSALRHTHRQMDWRKLNIDHGSRPRKCHSRDINGPLLPMDHPRSSLSGWAVLMILGAIAGKVLR